MIFCWTVTHCLDILHFLCSPVQRYLDSFYFWVIMRNAAVNTGEQILVQTYVFISFGWIPKSENTGWHDKYMFNKFKNCLTVFNVGYRPTFLPAMDESLFWFLHMPNASACLFVYGHSSECTVLSHCGFNFQFTIVQWYWETSHVIIVHLYAIFPILKLIFFLYYWVVRDVCTRYTTFVGYNRYTG